MVSIFRVFLIILFLTCYIGAEAAEVEFSPATTFDIGASPVDVAVSADGEHIFVLTKAGDILIYSSDGQLEDTMHVGNHVNFLAAGPSENQLLLGSAKKKTLQTITLEFTQEIDISGSPFQGSADAPVVIAVFMDYQCPYCARLRPLLEEVLELNPGKIKIVYKQYPLKSHKAAMTAAAAALVAFNEGKFQELHRLMEEGYRSLDNEAILDMASGLGFDTGAFKEKMTDSKVVAKIRKDIADGKQAGVSGIPTVFINGRRLKKRSLEGFQALIDQELEKLGGSSEGGGF